MFFQKKLKDNFSYVVTNIKMLIYSHDYIFIFLLFKSFTVFLPNIISLAKDTGCSFRHCDGERLYTARSVEVSA